MNLNFFEWLRDSVRQSVLLGVSDAVEQIGVPDNEPEVSPTLAALLGDHSQATKPTKSRRKTASSNANTGSRKRLGKSLKDMNTASS